MKPRWQHWIVWLLPFLVARALVPAGFMLSVGDGGLTLTFCPAAAPVSLSATAHHDPSHQLAHAHDAESTQHESTQDHESTQNHGSAQDQQHHSDHYRASDTGVCPFGVVGGTCVDANVHLTHLFIDSTSELLPPYTAPPDANRLIRADRIRGPPLVLLT